MAISLDSGDVIAKAFLKRWFRNEPAFRTHARVGQVPAGSQVDFLFALPGDAATPAEVFSQLRWGGQFILLARSANEVSARLADFNPSAGFAVDEAMGSHRHGWLPIPVFSTRFHYFIVRKVLLVPNDVTTDRFTFNVQLISTKEGYVVRKQVPSYSSVFKRLCDRHPEVHTDILSDRAGKLVDKVFPIFLTREVAFLQLLQRDMPEGYRDRVPKVLGVHKGTDNLVRKVHLNWMRLGCPIMSHLEFARQSADLLRVLHDVVGIIHLDLRLDNFIINEAGVCFVDFGSAVRVDEKLDQSNLLKVLFNEMLSTSKVQQALGRMKATGKVTNSVIAGAHEKVDKAVDLFYLAVQMKKPLANPDFKGLVEYDAQSDICRRLSLLTASVLRPRDPRRTDYASAADVLRGIERIGAKLSQPASASP